MNRLLTLVGTGLFHGITIILVATIVVYGIFSDWKKDEVSRHMMSYLIAFTVAFSYFSIRMAFPGLVPGYPLIRAFVYLGILYNVSRRLYLISKYQMKARRKAKVTLNGSD